MCLQTARPLFALKHHDKVCKDAELLHLEKAWDQTKALQSEGMFVGYAHWHAEIFGTMSVLNVARSAR